MAKMNFNFGAYGAGEIITRDELKKVLGGTGSGSSVHIPEHTHPLSNSIILVSD